jgi:hypothetical protein
VTENRSNGRKTAAASLRSPLRMASWAGQAVQRLASSDEATIIGVRKPGIWESCIGSGQRSRRFLPTRRPDNSSRDNRSAVLVNAVKLQHVLGQIDAKDCCRHEHLSHTCVTAIYQAFREGGVHPITVGLFQL